MRRLSRWERPQERVRWRRELERAVGDRDMTGTQLVRRNDELALLYEKMRLQEATIAQGRQAYGRAPDCTTAPLPVCLHLSRKAP